MATSSVCSAPGCHKPIRKRRHMACGMHDARMERHGSFNTPERPKCWNPEPQVGDRHGRLTVVGSAEGYLNKQSGSVVRRWRLRCDCGNEVVRQAFQIRKDSRHCGCERAFKPIPVGSRFGALTVVAEAVRDGLYWRVPCQCDCGASTMPPAFSLRTRKSQSCGLCMRTCADDVKQAVAAATTTHGWSGTPEYNAWLSMRKRCGNPKDRAYRNYGARGIRVCEAWQNDFLAFLEHVGPKPEPRLSIDRIDNEKGYEPGNVRWADASTQNRNRRAFVMRSSPI